MIDACGVAHPRWVGDEQTVGAWMNRMLNTQADVPAKLAAHPDAVERRALPLGRCRQRLWNAASV
jgi:hypothetical protein